MGLTVSPAGPALPVSAANGGTGIANNVLSTLTISGNFGTTITVSGTTTITLPTTGTVSTLAGSEALTNKTYAGSTMVLTNTTTPITLRYDSSNFLGIAISSQGRSTFNPTGTSPNFYTFNDSGTGHSVLFDVSNGGAIVTLGFGANSAFNTATSGSRSATISRFCLSGNPSSGATGVGDGGANTTVALMANGAVNFLVNTTVAKVASGIQFQLGNAATTGLAAGVLAATTNATIVIYDSSGQAYRVPAII